MYHTTADGQRVLISSMNTNHIVNTIKLLGGNVSRSYLAELLLRTREYGVLTALLEEIRDDELEDDDCGEFFHLGFGESF